MSLSRRPLLITLPRCLLTMIALSAGLSSSNADVRHDDAVPPALLPGGVHLTQPTSADRGALTAAFAGTTGEALFRRDWAAEAAAQGETPLGPAFDATRCGACHLEAEAATGPQRPIRVAKATDHSGRRRFPTQAHGQHRDGAGARLELRWRPARITAAPWAPLLRAPAAEAIAPDGQRHRVALRNAPALFGWGLLEHVPKETLQRFHDPEDRNGDGISGRLAGITEGHGQPGRAGIFGWKGEQQSLRGQIAAALVNDMGITTAATCRPACPGELDDAGLDALTDYVRYMKVPDQRRRKDAAVRRGSWIFAWADCTGCHVPVLTTARSGDSLLGDQVIWPYSDLLLHDMGPGLRDPGDAEDAAEWRTAPLWGIGHMLTHAPDRGLLHDGRARTIEEAILWHGGEAYGSRQHYLGLEASDRRALLAFVRSL